MPSYMGKVELLRAKLNFRGRLWESWVEELQTYKDCPVEKQLVVWASDDLPRVVMDMANVNGTMMPIRVFYPLVTNPKPPTPSRFLLGGEWRELSGYE